MAIGGEKLKKLQFIEEKIKNIVVDFDVEEYVFNEQIDQDCCEKLELLKKFPNQLRISTKLEQSEENLRRAISTSVDNLMSESKMDSKFTVLPSSACYFFYSMLEGTTMSNSRYFYTKKLCYRNESRVDNETRFESFNMIEYVCVGKKEDVLSFIDEMKEKVKLLLKSLGIPAEYKHATDHFFLGEKDPRFLLQKIAPLKFEIVVEGLAIGSFNFHQNYFSQRFNIKLENEDCYSGCVAFGLERWLFSYLNNQSKEVN